MRNRSAEFAVLLVTISLSLIIHLPTSLARTRPSVSKKAKEVPAQSPPYWDMEVAALRQQSEEQRQLLDTLRGQFEERRVAAEALGHAWRNGEWQKAYSRRNWSSCARKASGFEVSSMAPSGQSSCSVF